MSEFLKAATVSELESGQKLLVEVDERLVILFRIENQFFCIDDVCTHDGGTLSDGEFSGFEIECPRHGARFDVRCGEAKCMPATQNTIAHETKVDGDDILVKINESE
jgi:3-phenylpropionate/trans-cinnamate dioxygenase ferredoxin subunit